MKALRATFVNCHWDQMTGRLYLADPCTHEAELSEYLGHVNGDSGRWSIPFLRLRLRRQGTVLRMSGCYVESDGQLFPANLHLPNGSRVLCSQLQGYRDAFPLRHLRVLMQLDLLRTGFFRSHEFRLYRRRDSPDVANRRQLILQALGRLEQGSNSRDAAARRRLVTTLSSLDQLTARYAAAAYLRSTRASREESAARTAAQAAAARDAATRDAADASDRLIPPE